MGKVKQRRQRNARFNPIGLSEAVASDNVVAVGVNEEDSGDITPGGLKIIGERISSAVVEERLGGLNTLAALALDDHAATTIADSRLIRKVSLLLKDPNPEIRLVAAGALRNVSAGGSEEVVETMVQQDVLSPLSDLLHEYKDAWSPASNDLGEVVSRDVDPMTNIFVHATHFLLNLCECSEQALHFFNQEDLIHVLLPHLDPANWGHTLALAIAECLLCVSENNTNAHTAILPAADSLLQYISRTPDNAIDMHFAATIAGILTNIGYCSSTESNFQLFLQLLASILERDTLVHTIEYAAQSGSADTKPSLIPQDLEHLIVAQQLCLEILSNICCSEDDDEEWNDSEIVSDDEIGDAEESMDFGNKSVLSPEVQEGMKHFNLFQLSLRKVQYPDENTCQALQNLKYGPSLLSKLRTLQVRALLCLQNMISALDLNDIGGSDLMYQTWVNLGTMVFRDTCEDSMLEAATGAMRAIMEKLSQDKCEKLAKISLQDIKVILEAGVSCTIASVRGNLARMIGTLGCLLVSQNTEDSLYTDERTLVLSAITEFLLKVAAQDSELWVSAEALDVIIDLYSDDKTDRLAYQTCLVDSLKEIQPNFKSKGFPVFGSYDKTDMNYQKQKRRLGDHGALVMTVKDNLLAFIKYKGPRALKHRNA
ncbi:HEAT repeat-containing protein 3 isoform X1 [Macrobrachium rosenbergii]|uniref:HEAT repeat-containing protein 3 isoform X1 n=1 Tax=Macrobrachium rosenbergii TaxID=79674 RepID=UPI0034D46193